MNGLQKRIVKDSIEHSQRLTTNYSNRRYNPPTVKSVKNRLYRIVERARKENEENNNLEKIEEIANECNSYNCHRILSCIKYQFKLSRKLPLNGKRHTWIADRVASTCDNYNL